MHDEHDEPVERPHIEGLFVDVATAEILPPSWIIDGLIPPGLTFLAGPPKSKKSTITAAAAALVAEYPCLALPPELSKVSKAGPVMWFSAEASAGEIRHMMQSGLGIGEMEPREAILVAEVPWDWRLDDADGMSRLLSWLRSRDPRLVIIDPLRDFHQLEEKDSGGMNRLLRPIRQWAVAHDSAVMIVHHTKKLEAGSETTYSALDMRGTTALFGIADGVLMLTPRGKESEGRIFVQATFKRAQGWEKEITLAAYGVQEQGSEQIGSLEAQVARMLASGVTDMKEIADTLHVGVPQIIGFLGKAAASKQQAEASKRGSKQWTTPGMMTRSQNK